MTAEQVTFEDFSESPNRARDPARVDALADEIEAILTDPTRCTWCGTQVRQYDRDHDEAEAVHLSVGDTKAPSTPPATASPRTAPSTPTTASG
ncbi:hypothetical protein [Haloplanus litoreus]|uniref:Transposase n=1 Tax=Haloplanus litoreus TaxID=767515 RepID=A0ABD6A418_9EURY